MKKSGHFLISHLFKCPYKLNYAKITSKEILLEKINSIQELNPNIMQLTNGHDLMNAFAKYFREKEEQKGLTGNQIESSLRIVYDKNAFSQTILFQSLLEWQEINETEIF